MKEQLGKIPKELLELVLTDDLKDVIIENYNPYSTIKGEIAV